MYSSSYPRTKFGLESREPLHRPKGKSCGYYMRIVFFFSSLIQSLIIVSLVLFFIYGQPEKSAEEKRVKVSKDQTTSDVCDHFKTLSYLNLKSPAVTNFVSDSTCLSLRFLKVTSEELQLVCV